MIDFNAGQLNVKITLQGQSGGQDSYGQVNPKVWSDLATIFAQIVQKKSREFYLAQKVYAETTAVFKIHYMNGISVLHRIKYGSRNFEILGIDNPDQRNIALLLIAKEVI